MPKKIRVAMIGSGRMAYWHLKGYKKIRDVELVGIAGRSPSNIAHLNKKFKIANTYTDYRQLLSEQKPDAVNITTPTHTHCTIALESLNAGAHVLCEKPLAMTLNEADMMIAAEKKSGKILMPGFSQRFFKEFLHIKKIVDHGDLGNIRVAWFRRGIDMPLQKWYSEKDKSPGVTFELAIHAIDWLRWIIPSPVQQVSAVMTKAQSGAGIDDNIWMLLKFTSGTIGVIGASYAFPFLKRDIGIIGDKMALTVERCKVVLEKYGSHSLGKMLLKYILYSLIVPYWLYYNPFEKELREFISCIRDGSTPSITSNDGRESLAIACAAYESARTGKTIYL
ncbi:MAG: Gfo/Idh/MocA family oxidoreductase [Pseudomonadota bacterium]